MTSLKLLALCGALLLGLLGQRASAVPVIFHCTESAAPGDVIGIQGDSFGNTPQVWMLHVTGTESSLVPKVKLTVLSGTGSIGRSGSTSYVSALIPANETPGLYGIWVSSDGGATFGAGMYINLATAWNANDLCGSAVDPNRSFRLFGRNLRFPGTGTPTVKFVNGGTSLAATVTSGTDPYVLNVTAPAGLSNGVNYTLTVNNGFGGAYGDNTGPVLTGTLAISGTDVFGLGVPWGLDFSNYRSRVYTVPFVSSTTDASVAIQTAINVVSGSGGGIVALQSGTYKLSPGIAGNIYSFLIMKPNVVVQGAGMNNTQLLMSGTSTLDPIGYHFGFSDGGINLTNCGLADLTLYNTSTGASSNLSFMHTNHSKIFATRTHFIADAGKNVYLSGTQVVVRDCVIDNGPGAMVLSGTIPVWDGGHSVVIAGNGVVFKNNVINYYFGRLVVGFGNSILAEGNTVNRIAINNGMLLESGGFDVSVSKNCVVLNNTLQKSGTSNLTENNDGETIMAQGGNSYPDQGVVTSATNSPAFLLTDTSKNWLVIAGSNNFNYGAAGLPNYSVAIINGVGTGQIRQIVSSSSNTLTVDHAWDVTPAAGSTYTISQIGAQQHLIKDNTLSGNRQGISYYSVSTQDVALVNNTMNDSGGIMLRADYRSGWHRHDIQMDTLVTGNSVTYTAANPYPTGMFAIMNSQANILSSDNKALGTVVYGTEFRKNTITAPVPNRGSGLAGEGFGSISATNGNVPLIDGSTTTIIGAIFQGNTVVSASNAFHTMTGDYSTLIWENPVSNCGNLIWDGTGSGTTHASSATVYGAIVGYWNFDNAAQDLSGNLNNGTLIGSPTYSTDVPFNIAGDNPYSIQFTGTNSVQVNNSPTINPNNEMTVALWIKSGTNQAGYSSVIGKADPLSSSTTGWKISRLSTGSGIYMRIDTSAGNNQTIQSSTANVFDNTWHHIAYVLNNGVATFYKDGVFVISRAYNHGGGFGNASQPLVVGRTNYTFAGNIDEVQIFDSALSASQISILYNTR